MLPRAPWKVHAVNLKPTPPPLPPPLLPPSPSLQGCCLPPHLKLQLVAFPTPLSSSCNWCVSLSADWSRQCVRFLLMPCVLVSISAGAGCCVDSHSATAPDTLAGGCKGWHCVPRAASRQSTRPQTNGRSGQVSRLMLTLFCTILNLLQGRFVRRLYKLKGLLWQHVLEFSMRSQMGNFDIHTLLTLLIITTANVAVLSSSAVADL